jgi:hypothetical protein
MILLQYLEPCCVEWYDDKWMMNWKGFEGSGCGIILSYCPNIRLEGLRETKKTLSE